MMKRVLFLLFLLLTALLMSACRLTELFLDSAGQRTDETVTPYLEVVPDELTYSEGYDPIVSSYAYDALTLEGEKQLYQKMLDVCYDISPEKSEDTDRYPMPQIELKGYSLTEAQVRTAAKALTDDHPEIFWTTGTIGYYSDDSMTIVQVYSSYAPEEVDERVNAVRAVAAEFYSTVPDDLSAFDRELMVHDYLIGRVAYDENVDAINLDNNNPDIYTVYGTLVNGSAVCEGYARAFQMLMNGLGVDCVGLMGSSKDQMHMWNAVKLDGSWYQTDVTWDDQKESYARHIYFNVSDDYMFEDHTLSPLFTTMSDDEINGDAGDYNASVMNIFVPECGYDDMGYYYRCSPHLSDYDGADVKSGLLSAAEKQEEYFVFYIEDNLDYETALNDLFVSYPQHFFTYINAVNNTLSDYSIDSSNLSYFKHEKSRIAAVALHYY